MTKSLAAPREEMADSNCDVPNDGATHTDDDPPEDSRFASSFLDELRRDDASAISYSYYSTVSTNFTMSNLPGPGRNLGNFYSWAGAALERRMNQLAERADAKRREEAIFALQSERGLYRMFWGDDPREHEKACKMLLICAKSDNIKVQIDAFREIVWGVIKCPTKVRSALRRVLERQKEVGDVIASSWNRSGVVGYTLEWVYWHDMASRCLSTSPEHNAFFDATAQFDGAKFQSLNFSRFEGLLLRSSDTTDLILAIRFITSYWDGDGAEGYVQTKGFNDPALLRFATGLITLWEPCFYRPGSKTRANISLFYFSAVFLAEMTRSFTFEDGDELIINVLDDFADHDGVRLQMMWANIFKLHHILRSSWYFEQDFDIWWLSSSWGELCHDYLPNLEHAMLRAKLLALEDKYEPTMRNRFPPQKDGIINLQEKGKPRTGVDF